MIYPPAQREPRTRGRMSPAREAALVVVAVALVLALLFPIAFPAVPVPRVATPARVALAPATPVSLPQPHASGTPGAGTVGGPAPGMSVSGGTTAVPTPFDPGTPFGVSPTEDPFALPVATAADRFPAGLPTRALRATRAAVTELPSAYPGYGPSVTPAAPALSATPTGSGATVTVTPTTATGTSRVTPGAATATVTPTVLGNYP